MPHDTPFHEDAAARMKLPNEPVKTSMLVTARERELIEIFRRDLSEWDRLRIRREKQQARKGRKA